MKYSNFNKLRVWGFQCEYVLCEQMQGKSADLYLQRNTKKIVVTSTSKWYYRQWVV